MTNASRSTQTVTEHRFVVPCEKPFGGDWKDFDIAQHWARQKAEELGIDISYDDWSRLHVEDDQLVIVITEIHQEPPVFLAGTLTEAYGDLIDIINQVKTDETERNSREYVDMIIRTILKHQEKAS